MKSAQHLVVVGLGYVGLPLALLASQKGYQVTGFDINEKKIEMIRDRKSPFVDREVEELLRTTTLEAISDSEVIREAQIIVVCVPTPVYDDYIPDLGPVKKSSQMIGERLQKGQLIILESTVNPGVCDEVIVPILEAASGLKAGRDFYLAHCPERINPGDVNWTVRNIARVVGGYDPESLRQAAEFYRSIIEAPIKEMNSLKEAEAVKVVENSFRDVNIAFVNELAMSFSKLGIDVLSVIEGAITKPFAFLAHYPGCGVGGHCIPVDPYYLIEYAKKNGFHHEFLSLARRINNQMPEFTVSQLLSSLAEKGIDPIGARVAVLGLSYKPGIDDSRESPAYRVIELLKEKGMKVVVYDPFVKSDESVSTLGEALTDARAVVIVTAHSEFKSLDPDQLISKNVGIVVDGRNCLPRELFIQKGLTYKGIGR